MADRTIHVTVADMARLRGLIHDASVSVAARPANNLDRPYLDRLADELDRAVVVRPEDVPPDVVTMNSRVRLRDGVRTWIMTLVFPDRADAEDGRISVLAPLGAAVLGTRVGDRVEFRVPGGGQRSCDVMSVLYQPEALGATGS